MPESPYEFTAGNTPDAPRSDLPDLLTALAADLRAVNYTLDGVANLLGEPAYTALNRDQTIPALLAAQRAVREDGAVKPLAAVVRLWLLAEPQLEETLDAALPAIRAEGLLALGLVEPVPGTGLLAAKADLRPYGWEGTEGHGNSGSGGAELWVASDLAAHQQEGVLRHDHVLGIGQASTTLVQTTFRRHTERALDLGTGCGIQAFHLLHHCGHVTATDISERALAFTRFNILLNAKALSVDPDRLEDRVSLRLGSLLEPVAGGKFGLVVSNPPFVITPRSPGEDVSDQFTYRDGGLPGDGIVAALVAELPAVLAPGGTAQMLGNWEVSAGTGWQERPQAWVGPGVDAWFIQRELVSPAEYAETWLRDASEGRDREHYRDAYAAYLADFQSRNVAGIGFGMVLLRRPVSPGPAAFTRFEEITYPIEQPIGPHLGAALDRQDWLAANSIEDAHLLVADDVTEERHQRPGAEHPGVILLRQGAGLRRTNLLSTELAGFVSACDGDLTAGQIAGALEALLGGALGGGLGGDPGAEASAEEAFDAGSFRSALLAEAANLVRDGFLIPATD